MTMVLRRWLKFWYGWTDEGWWGRECPLNSLYAFDMVVYFRQYLFDSIVLLSHGVLKPCELSPEISFASAREIWILPDLQLQLLTTTGREINWDTYVFYPINIHKYHRESVVPFPRSLDVVPLHCWYYKSLATYVAWLYHVWGLLLTWRQGPEKYLICVGISFSRYSLYISRLL